MGPRGTPPARGDVLGGTRDHLLEVDFAAPGKVVLVALVHRLEQFGEQAAADRVGVPAELLGDLRDGAPGGAVVVQEVGEEPGEALQGVRVLQRVEQGVGVHGEKGHAVFLERRGEGWQQGVAFALPGVGLDEDRAVAAMDLALPLD